MSELIKYNFYTHRIDNKEVIVKILANGSISNNVSSIEIYKNKNWQKDVRVAKSFMSKYITGWITKEDILDPKIVEEAILTGMSYRTIIARNLALEKHKNQKYGKYSYEIHLTNVVSTLLHFGYSFNDDILIMSAWLHDIIEDTEIDKVILYRYFGEEVRNIVELVSNYKDITKTKEENKTETFKRIATNQNAINVKLADRISNVEFSLLHGSINKIEKYKNEQIIIDDVLEPKIDNEKGKQMYTHLKKLLK